MGHWGWSFVSANVGRCRGGPIVSLAHRLPLPLGRRKHSRRPAPRCCLWGAPLPIMAMTPRERYAASALVSLPSDVPQSRPPFPHLAPPQQRRPPAAASLASQPHPAPVLRSQPPASTPTPQQQQQQQQPLPPSQSQQPPLPPPPPPHQEAAPVLSSCAQAGYAAAAAAVVTAALASAAPALARLHVSVAHVRLASDSGSGTDIGPPVVWLDGDVIDGVNGVGGVGGGGGSGGGGSDDGSGGGRRVWGSVRHDRGVADGSGGGGAASGPAGVLSGNGGFGRMGAGTGGVSVGGRAGRIAPPPLWRAGAPSPGMRFSPTSDLAGGVGGSGSGSGGGGPLGNSSGSLGSKNGGILSGGLGSAFRSSILSPSSALPSPSLWLMNQAVSPPLQPGGVFSTSGVSAGVLPTPSGAGLSAGPWGPAATTPGTVAAVTAAAVGLDSLWPRSHHRPHSRATTVPPPGPPVPPVFVPTGSGDGGDADEERDGGEASAPGGGAGDSVLLSKRPSFWTTVIPGGRSARALGADAQSGAMNGRQSFVSGPTDESGGGSSGRGKSNCHTPPSSSVSPPSAATGPAAPGAVDVPFSRQAPLYMPLPSPFPLPSPMPVPSPMEGVAGAPSFGSHPAAREWGRPPIRGSSGGDGGTVDERHDVHPPPPRPPAGGSVDTRPPPPWDRSTGVDAPTGGGRAPSGVALPKRRKGGSGGRPPPRVPPAVQLPSPRAAGGGGGAGEDRPASGMPLLASNYPGGLPPPPFPSSVLPSPYGGPYLAAPVEAPGAEGGGFPLQTPKTAMYSAAAAAAEAVTSNAHTVVGGNHLAGPSGATAPAAAAAVVAGAGSATSSGGPTTGSRDDAAAGEGGAPTDAPHSQSTSVAASVSRRPPAPRGNRGAVADTAVWGGVRPHSSLPHLYRSKGKGRRIARGGWYGAAADVLVAFLDASS